MRITKVCVCYMRTCVCVCAATKKCQNGHVTELFMVFSGICLGCFRFVSRINATDNKFTSYVYGYSIWREGLRVFFFIVYKRGQRVRVYNCWFHILYAPKLFLNGIAISISLNLVVTACLLFDFMIHKRNIDIRICSLFNVENGLNLCDLLVWME